MNCTEFAEWTGPYLCGELDTARCAMFEAHRNSCAACDQTLEATRIADAWVRRVAHSQHEDPALVLRGAREAIAARMAMRRWLGIAAAVALTLAGSGYWMTNAGKPTGIAAAAARDHRVEVVRRTPRSWRALAEAKPLLDEYGVTSTDVDALLPARFILEKAKQCGIDGRPTLHMVFTDGKRKLSVYVEKPGTRVELMAAVLDDAEVASFRRGTLSGIVVSTAPGLCAEAVRRLSAL